MARYQSVQSVEPQVADRANGWMRDYGLDYKLEQESLNSSIDNALNTYKSKSGGMGGNRPDAKLILRNSNLHSYPILIEYKGYEGKLVKLDANGQVENKTEKNEPNYKNIKSYAVNGAIHYANALLHYTDYTEVIAIGMTGWLDTSGLLQHEIGVYYVSKSNYGAGQKVDEYIDFSFLKQENFDAFIEKVKALNLTEEEIEIIREKREREITTSLVKLNNDIYRDEKNLGENERVYLVVATIMANLGVSGAVTPLESSSLLSSPESGNTDGEIVMRKIRAFLYEKHLPEAKRTTILNTLGTTLLNENINRPVNGETQLKRVFTKIIDDLGIYYKIGLSTDFTGKLFNEMYSWLGFSQDKLNDVVLTPPYVGTLLAKLARVNKDSYVWDFATGSAGLLVAAMNEMLNDAKQRINSPDELLQKELKIKAEQILGIEVLPNIYMLAVLNMILMGDGSANILNKDSLRTFDGKYGYGRANEKFPANAFVLNPPYSASGNGMVFVAKALSMMKSGYAAIIIQNSAGSGKAKNYTIEILKNHTLIASIKMPIDLFVGKSSVQTYIYVFQVGIPHNPEALVKFIDFSNDGYTRTNRKKASTNLRDTDHARERYQEVVNLVHIGKSKLHYLKEEDYYESTIDPNKGDDWNQRAPIDAIPKLSDFRKTVSNYLAWEVASLLQKEIKEEDGPLNRKLECVEWGEYRIGDLFDSFNGDFDIQKNHINGQGEYVITSGIANNGIAGRTDVSAKVFDKNTITIDMFGNAFYRNFRYKMVTHARVFSLKPKFAMSERQGLFFANAFNWLPRVYSYDEMCSWEKIKNASIFLPTNKAEIDFAFMEHFVTVLEAHRIDTLKAYLDTTGLSSSQLTIDEKIAISDFENIQYGRMKIPEIFDVK